MAGLSPGGLNSGRDLHGFFIRNRLQALDDALGMFWRVERFQRRFAGAFTFAIAALHIASLNAGRVPQDKRSHLDRGWRREHGRGVTPFRQQRQSAGMIEMAMSEQYGIKLLLCPGWRAIQRFGFFASLKE